MPFNLNQPASTEPGAIHTYAHAWHGVWSATKSLDTVTDEELVALMLEPEFMADCSGLERELVIRLASRLEFERELGI